MRSEYRISNLDFETIASRMKADLRNPPNKVEGSFASDNIQAVAKEILKYYDYVAFLQDQHYAETAIGEYLDKKAAEVGVFRKNPTKARGLVTFVGKEGTFIKEGFKVFSDNNIYQTLQPGTIGEDEVLDLEVEALEEGKASNVEANVINRFEGGVYGLVKVYNKKPISGGTELEDDDSLRERTLLRMRYPGTSGNQYHYMHWAREVEGVGRVKVFPVWDGPGTVKVSILDSNQKKANEELIQKVKTHIDGDAERNGEALAPIGALLTVTTAEEVGLNIAGQISVRADSYASPELIAEAFKSELQLYIDREISYKQNKLTVAKIIDILYSVEGVEDIEELTVNGSVDTIRLEDEQILKVESVVFNE